MSSKADPCQKYACELQVCLQKNNYQEDKCQETIKRLVKCCFTWKEESFKVRTCSIASNSFKKVILKNLEVFRMFEFYKSKVPLKASELQEVKVRTSKHSTFIK